MILRTPPKKRKSEPLPAITADNQLVIYEDPNPESPHQVKADFLEALSSNEKEVDSLQSKLEQVNEEMQRKEVESKKFESRLRFVEQELAAAKGREQMLQKQYMKDVTDFQERHQKLLKDYSELEVKLKKEVNIRKNLESTATAAEEKALILEEKLQKLTEIAEREKKHLQNELSYFQNDSRLSVSKINAERELFECRAINAEKEAELFKRQLFELKNQLEECIQKKNEAENKLLSLNVPTQEPNSEGTRIRIKNLQDELRNYESEVQEARKLKSFHANAELLKEKISEERFRREQAEAELIKVQESQTKVDKLQDELMPWKSMIKEIPGAECCEDIPKKFAVMQKELVESMLKVGEVNGRLKELEITLEKALLDKQDAETQLGLAKKKEEEMFLELKRLELTVTSITGERDRLWALIATYEKEAAIAGKMDGTSGTGGADENRVKELELSLAEKEHMVSELEHSFCEQKEVIGNQHREIELLSERLNNEARRIKSLEREGYRLRSEISLLESKLGHGDYSAANTKVLRMANTLGVDNEAKQTIEALRDELQKTQARLKAVEEFKGQTDAGHLVDSSITEKLAELKKQIATLEKREERYKTVFAEKISIFRRACCALFGYKIVMDDQQRPNGIPVTFFTLHSIYAQSDDEKLEFEYESGNTNIVMNTYTSQPDIAQQMEIYVRKWNAIPAFTANLTVESFSRTTIS
ncbi:hypothetical protein AMTR_s00099p00119010 [Amborella trichopoda]|uniref:Spindle assembly checkpoint component MAD1 n=1 Tax=Amborella trichopoda TaxID=13333 RepID=W1NRY7_AMBTC|nr:hypothetical protein AMTR_s00099p00119010 [Amborella trichopoda]